MASVPQVQRQQFLSYVLAVLVTAAAVVVTRLVQPLVAPSVTPPFILAVAIVALYGGRGPGVVASLLSLAALHYWFFPPFQLHSPPDFARQAMFLVVATVTAWIAGTAHRQRAKAEEASRLAEKASQQAEEEAVKAEESAAEAETAAQDAADALAGQLEAEHSLRQSEKELSDFFDNATTAIHWIGEDGTLLRANQAELDMLGYERGEYVGHHIAEFHVDGPVIDDILSRLLAGQAIRHYPARLRCKDGQIKEVLIDSSAYQVEGRFVHTRCFTRDVTLEKQSQEARARFEAIVASSSDAIIGKTLNGIVTSWNAAAERIFGYTAPEMVGESIFRLIPEALHDSEREILERLRRGETVEFSETERVRKGGERIWISLSVSPIRDSAGTVIGAASIKRDVTQRKIVEERLRDTQRLRAVGQLAGGIAHEANNQMSVVLGAAQFLRRLPDLPPSARDDVEFIRQAAERTASITRQLLAFSRRQVFELQDVDVNRVVESIEPVLRRSLAENHELVVRLGRDLGLVRADPRQLEQVLLNLTLNARDAMPGGGQLSIETHDTTIPADASEGGPSRLPPGRYAVLVLEDTGHGMDEATLAQAFEPFFTTKEVGQGTGLGLSVVHGIVNQTGGHIRTKSVPGKGARFELHFPVLSTHRVAETSEASDAVLPNHGRVALVVEDDALVRRMATRGLIEAGYIALEAEHGQAALDLVLAHSGRLDVVITDIGMPEMDGHELARRLREVRPDLPVVFMSGYGEVDVARPLLQKPFAPDVLVRTVGDVLASKSGV